MKATASSVVRTFLVAILKKVKIRDCYGFLTGFFDAIWLAYSKAVAWFLFEVNSGTFELNGLVVDRERKMRVKRLLTFEDSKIKEIGLSNRIKAFKNQIVKELFYICVIYNRTLYKTSMILFLETKYETSSDSIFSSRVKVLIALNTFVENVIQNF